MIDDGAPNAFATGRSPQHASVVVTTGLLDLLDRVELEGVLAHELSHIKNDDVVVATLAVTLVGLVTPQLVPSVVGHRREPSADVSAVEMTRYPPGLISALEKLRDDTTGGRRQLARHRPPLDRGAGHGSAEGGGDRAATPRAPPTRRSRSASPPSGSSDPRPVPGGTASTGSPASRCRLAKCLIPRRNPRTHPGRS